MAATTAISIGIFTFFAGGFILFETVGFIIHLRREPWPKHALFHMITGLMYLQSLCAIIIILAWFPFRDGQLWSWWSIMGATVALYASHFLGDPLSGGGLHSDQTAAAPPWVLNFLNALAVISYSFALGISYQHFF